MEAFFGDKELSREFITSRTVSDVHNFVKKMSKQDPTEQQVKDITNRYQEFYINSLQKAFGLSDGSMMELHLEFKDISDKMLRILKVNEGKDPDIFDQNKKYLETYPYLYFSVVPRQIIQSRLADKAVKENRMLRANISSISQSVGELVKKISEIETSYGVPPIARSVFEAIPDPISVQYDTKFGKYKDDMDTFYKISSYLRSQNSKSHSDFLMNPVRQIKVFIDKGVSFATKDELESLKLFITGINNSSKKSSSNLIDFVVPE